MSRDFHTLLRLLAGFCWALMPLGCAQPPPAKSDMVRPVKTMLVTAGDETRQRTFPGKVEASKNAELAFQVPGLLINLPVKEGQRVAKGDIIGQVRPDEFQARLKTLQGQLDQAQAQLRALRSGERPEQLLRLDAQVRAAESKLANARAENQRNAQLLRSNAVSRQDFEATETAYRVAQEELKAAVQLREKGAIAREEDIDAKEGAVRGLEGRVVEAQLQLDDTTLRAPFDGVIAKRFVEPNQNVRAKEPIVRFQDVDEIEIIVDVPETIMAGEIRAADIVKMVAEFSAAPGLQFPVHLKEVAQVADPVTQTFRVRVGMQAQPGINLLPGMTGTVTVSYRRAAILGSSVFVPINAVFSAGGQESAVWVIGTGQTVSRRVVKLGFAEGGRVQVLEGLGDGDRIAIAGVSQLREGMKVRDLGDALGGGR